MIPRLASAKRYARLRIRTRKVVLTQLARVVVALMLSCDVLAGSRQAAPTSYADVIELYRRGNDQLALKQLAALTDTVIKIGSNKLLDAFNNGGFAEAHRAAALMSAAAVLHTVRALVARAQGDVGEFQYQFKFARAYIDLLVSKGRRVIPFVQTWQLFVMSSYHGQMGVQAAREFGRGVRDPHGESALLLLALGATEEMGWSRHQEEDAPAYVDGDLKEAERLYRQALLISPELVEARLRLGRVLALRRDDEAVKTLDQIGEAIETPFQYLARLFEGDLHEPAGKLSEAERQYLAAVILMPQSQSAFMALAHVRHAQGARAQSAQDVRVTTGARGVPDTADPWFWYARGTAWRGPRYLEDLRKMIAP